MSCFCVCASRADVRPREPRPIPGCLGENRICGLTRCLPRSVDCSGFEEKLRARTLELRLGQQPWSIQRQRIGSRVKPDQVLELLGGHGAAEEIALAGMAA